MASKELNAELFCDVRFFGFTPVHSEGMFLTFAGPFRKMLSFKRLKANILLFYYSLKDSQAGNWNGYANESETILCTRVHSGHGFNTYVQIKWIKKYLTTFLDFSVYIEIQFCSLALHHWFHISVNSYLTALLFEAQFAEYMRLGEFFHNDEAPQDTGKTFRFIMLTTFQAFFPFVNKNFCRWKSQPLLARGIEG